MQRGREREGVRGRMIKELKDKRKKLKDEILTRESTAQDDVCGVR
jgi:hypothetical protein